MVMEVGRKYPLCLAHRGLRRPYTRRAILVMALLGTAKDECLLPMFLQSLIWNLPLKVMVNRSVPYLFIPNSILLGPLWSVFYVASEGPFHRLRYMIPKPHFYWVTIIVMARRVPRILFYLQFQTSFLPCQKMDLFSSRLLLFSSFLFYIQFPVCPSPHSSLLTLFYKCIFPSSPCLCIHILRRFFLILLICLPVTI